MSPVGIFTVASLTKPDNLDEEKAKYNRLIKKGKELGRRGCLEGALDLFQRAYKIFESEKLLRKIEKVKVKDNICHSAVLMLSHCTHVPLKSETVSS